MISVIRLTIRVTVVRAGVILNVLQLFSVTSKTLVLLGMKQFLKSSLASVLRSFMVIVASFSQPQTLCLTLKNQASVIM